MKNNSHKTAITRKKPSLPMRNLDKKGLLQGKLLDFGCGKGFDANHFGMFGYDPNHAPKKPKGKFDTITCNYVLNVVQDDEVQGVIEDVLKYLKKKGTAYVTVRRDLKKEGATSIGTYQKNVTILYPILTEKKGGFCTYIVTH